MEEPTAAAEAADRADAVREAGEDDQPVGAAALAAARRDRFRVQTGFSIAVLAALLAITSLGGSNATKNMINSNIQASDTFAFFQAKNIRQTSIRLALDHLELELPSLPPEQQAAARRKMDQYRATIARYESEPDTGEGKKELLAKANEYVAERERAQRQDPYFDYAQALFQIAIVLGSLSIVVVARPMLYLALVLGAVATLLMIDGYTLLVNLPLG